MLPAEPKAEDDNTYRDLDYLGYHKKRISLFIIHCLIEENNDKHTVARNRIDIVLGNHALHMQTTD